MNKHERPSFIERILIIVGGYGSGKTEVAVNLSRYLAQTTADKVAIADLDIVNPYFRSRETNSALEALGVRCINPTGGEFYADLPIILPEIKGAIERRDELLVLDVGGDDAGARVLSSLAGSFEAGSYEMMLVLNGNRPFTADVEGCLKMIGEIEESSRLKFTGIISNTHLLDETTATTVLDGLRLAREVGKRSGLAVKFLAGLRTLLGATEFDDVDLPVLPLERLLLKPWESGAQ
ncbi:MAG: cobalamin biosynthesis protein CbiA [candidate division Zixibacteria bacterium]|nr:cobalamin biosynthesis protein CbiA [candidate division Zixibacteria bacterium]MDH3937346.1 cobalamin biosynthesis protein CbiA [candidate division Zixibacteria bacterium]